jgi:hypothetical protein
LRRRAVLFQIRASGWGRVVSCRAFLFLTKGALADLASLRESTLGPRNLDAENQSGWSGRIRYGEKQSRCANQPHIDIQHEINRRN